MAYVFAEVTHIIARTPGKRQLLMVFQGGCDGLESVKAVVCCMQGANGQDSALKLL
jgi:hypothetical protein